MRVPSPVWFVWLSGSVLTSGCDGPGVVPDDAAVAVDAGDLVLASPTPPAFVVFACPEGWRTIESLGATICEPWPTDEAPHCGPLELALPGQPAGSECQEVQPCPSGPWPTDAPTDAIHLQPGATGGDGTAAMPYGDLATAVSLAHERRVPLVLGEGELAGFDATGIPRVIGLCPARTRVLGGSDVAIRVTSGTTEISGLSAQSDGYLGIEGSAGATVRLHGVVAVGFTNGIRARGTLEGDRVLARGPVVDRPAEFVPAVLAYPNAQVTLRHATLGGAGGALASPVGGATQHASVTLEDSAILDVPYGGIGALDLTLRRVALERASIALGISPSRSGTLEDVRVRAIGETTYGGQSTGLMFVSSSFVLRRVAVTDVRGFAIALLTQREAPGTLDAEDVFVARTEDITGTRYEDRIAVLVSGSQASASLRRAHVADLQGNAFQVEDGALDASDVRVIDAHDAGPGWGHAFQVRGGTLTLARAEVRPDLFGVFVLDDARATVTDLEQGSGQGLQVQCQGECSREGTSLSLTRASLHDLRRVALLATQSTIELADVSIADVESLDQPFAADTIPGAGLVAVGSDVHGERVSVERVGGIGVMAYDGASMTLSRVIVRDVTTADCECGPDAYGDGVLWSRGATLDLDDFEIERAARGGLVAAWEHGASALVGSAHDCGIGLITDPRTPADPTAFAHVSLDRNGVGSLVSEVTIGESESSPWRYAPANGDPSTISF